MNERQAGYHLLEIAILIMTFVGMMWFENSAVTGPCHFDPRSGEKSLKSPGQRTGSWRKIKQRP
jgi:hypothetical protein